MPSSGNPVEVGLDQATFWYLGQELTKLSLPWLCLVNSNLSINAWHTVTPWTLTHTHSEENVMFPATPNIFGL